MTVTTYGPPWRVDGPPPIAPLYGLLPAASAPAAGVRIVPDADAEGIDRWINGVQVFSYPPDKGDVYDPCGSGSGSATKGFGLSLNNPEFAAMTVWLAETCTSPRVWDQDAFKARAVTAFSAIESAAIAAEFMNGARIPTMPHLSDGNGSFPNGDVVTSAVNGLSLLEYEIALSGKQGIIHCSPQTLTATRPFFIVDQATGVIRTINGIVVIPGFGYAGAFGPSGHADPNDTEEWAYATGPIDIRRSEIFTTPDTFAQALDRGNAAAATTGRPNTFTYRAERYYAIDWDLAVHAAVLVDRCGVNCVTGS